METDRADWRRFFTIKRIFWGGLAVGFAGLLVLAFLPQAVPVELGTVQRGGLRVTVDEDGETRIRERYVISTPLSGRLQRINLDPGDAIVAEETRVASVEPADPALLDARSRAQAEAQVKAAQANAERARAAHLQSGAGLEQAKGESYRQRVLFEQGNTSQQRYDDAVYKERAAEEEYRSAALAIQIAEFELEQARAALIHSRKDEEAVQDPETWRYEIRSPISGKVLRVFQESSTFVAAGERLVEVGDPTDLEVQIDVMSNDAVKVRPGQRVILEHWGGERPLEALVRLVEPSAFTKVSALGVEEQRVYVVADLVDAPETRPTLGDGFRVEARIVVWEEAEVLKVPSGALFREKGQWAVFVEEAGRARLREVEIGQNSGLEAEVLAGLVEGERVVSHPSDRVEEGTLLVARE